MEKKDFGVFAEIMVVLNETFGNNTPLSELKIEFFFKALSDLSIDDIERGALSLSNRKTIKAFPTPAEIREAINGKPEDQAIIAVDKIQRALRGVGGYQTVCFDDPIIHLIIQNYGGWAKLSDITSEEWKWLKKDFIKHYQVYAGRGTSLTAIPASLPGMHEMVNAAKGLPWPEDRKVYIGDQAKALAWVGKRKELAAAKVDPVKKLTSWISHSMDTEAPNA